MTNTATKNGPASRARGILAELLAGLRRRRRGDAWVFAQLKARGPVETNGHAAADLRGRCVGTFVVVGYLCSDPTSPFWVGRCGSCGAFQPLRASSIRSGVEMRHVGCPGASAS